MPAEIPSTDPWKKNSLSLSVFSCNKIINPSCLCIILLPVRQTRFNRGNYRTREFLIFTPKKSPDQEFLSQRNLQNASAKNTPKFPHFVKVKDTSRQVLVVAQKLCKKNSFSQLTLQKSSVKAC